MRPRPPKDWHHRPGRWHWVLWAVVRISPKDYAPYGNAARGSGDCSCSCVFYQRLLGPAGGDWGVCTNRQSHRCGLLTFEHQGCARYQPPKETTWTRKMHKTTGG